jgi:hypothetical protein
MTTVAAETPVTVPVVFTVAMAPLLLAHVPPDGAEPNVIAEPTHTADGPVIAVGCVLTVITAETLHPAAEV